MMTASTTIKKLRINLGLDQIEFADELGVSKSTISKYESGDRTPRFRIARKIKQLAADNNIQISIEELLNKD